MNTNNNYPKNAITCAPKYRDPKDDAKLTLNKYELEAMQLLWDDCAKPIIHSLLIKLKDVALRKIEQI